MMLFILKLYVHHKIFRKYTENRFKKYIILSLRRNELIFWYDVFNLYI